MKKNEEDNTAIGEQNKSDAHFFDSSNLNLKQKNKYASHNE